MTRNKQPDIVETVELLGDSMKSPNGHQRCLIVNEATSTYGYRDLAANLIPERSIPVIEDGHITHLLGFDGKMLWPIDYMPQDNEDKTPQDCFEAGAWDELEEILFLGSKMMEKVKLGIFVGLCVGELIMLFLLAMTAGG